MKTYKPILPCIFCKSTFLTVKADEENPLYFVHCDSCDAQGPKKVTEKMAIDSWNRRDAE